MSTRWIYNKTFNICGIYSSLEEEFEFCWSSTADRWTQHFTKIDQEKRRIEQICLWNPMTTVFIIWRLIYVIGMEFLSLSRRRSSSRNVLTSEERGETDVFAGYVKARWRWIQGELTLLIGSEGARYPYFTNQIVFARTNPLWPLLEELYASSLLKRTGTYFSRWMSADSAL